MGCLPKSIRNFPGSGTPASGSALPLGATARGMWKGLGKAGAVILAVLGMPWVSWVRGFFLGGMDFFLGEKIMLLGLGGGFGNQFI